MSFANVPASAGLATLSSAKVPAPAGMATMSFGNVPAPAGLATLSFGKVPATAEMARCHLPTCPRHRIAWTAESGGRFANVGEPEANARGLHDMLGSVFEWCSDRWGESGPRIIRGGGYHEPARLARASAWMVRDAARPSARVGFRVVLGPVMARS